MLKSNTWRVAHLFFGKRNNDKIKEQPSLKSLKATVAMPHHSFSLSGRRLEIAEHVAKGTGISFARDRRFVIFLHNKLSKKNDEKYGSLAGG